MDELEMSGGARRVEGEGGEETAESEHVFS